MSKDRFPLLSSCEADQPPEPPLMQIQEDTRPPERLLVGESLPDDKSLPQEETLTPAILALPSLNDSVVLISSSPVPKDFQFYQDLLKRMATALGIEPKLV